MRPTQMRMLQMICSKTLKDKVTSELLLMITGVKLLKEFFRSQRLRCLGHVEKIAKKKLWR